MMMMMIIIIIIIMQMMMLMIKSEFSTDLCPTDQNHKLI